MLFVKKKENPGEEQGEVFMAIAHNIGYSTYTQRYKQTSYNDLPIILAQAKGGMRK